MEDRAVILPHEGLEQCPGRALRPRKIDVTAPDPARVLAPCFDQRDRLRIVDQCKIGVGREVARRLAIGLEEEVAHRLRQRLVRALKPVVNALRHLVELGRTGDHLPARVDAEVAEQRQHAAQDLRHAAAFLGRVDVQKRKAREAVGQVSNEPRGAGRREGRIVFQPECVFVHAPAPATRNERISVRKSCR